MMNLKTRSVHQSIGDVDAEIKHGLDVKRLACDHVPEGLSLEQFHGDKRSSTRLIDFVYRTYIRVIERGRGFCFPLETAESLCIVSEFVRQELQRDEAIQLQIFGFVDDTPYGGSINNYGVVFKFVASGTLTTLHAFTGPDGYSPGGPLFLGSDGNFWGTTAYNTTGQGTIFKVAPEGILTTEHVFSGTDGELPAALIQNTNGTLYGSANLGGTSNAGRK